MTDPPFLAPTTLHEALDAISDGEALVVGGGTSLAVLFKQRFLEPEKLVWVGKIQELKGLTRTADGGWHIGALTTVAEIAGSPEMRLEHSMLAHAARVIANPRIRAVATIGGAVVHADPRQDLPPALLAADASARIVGPRGERTMPLRDGFFRGFLETAVEPDELVTGVLIPPADGAEEAYERFTPQSKDDYPTVSVAARIERGPSGEVSRLALALGGVASAPLLVDDVGTVLGPSPTADDIARVAEIARAATSPTEDERGSAAYKAAMAEVWTRRVLTKLLRTPVTSGHGG